MNEYETTARRAHLYQTNSKIVHIATKKGIFYNGLIIYVGADFIEFKDNKLGDVPIFFSEILRIEPYKKEDNGDKIAG